MSGIAGIYHLDDRPVDRDALERMTAAMAHRGRDGGGVWMDRAVGVGHRMFQTTPESVFEKQPLTDESGRICLTLDGRVDNREELGSRLTAGGFRLRDDTDAELVIRAYEAWGDECAARIIGDFAFAIWDGRRRHLLCARDVLGIRPFYYFAGGRTFLFASEPRALVESGVAPKRPNEGMIAEYLSCDLQSVEETLYEGILRLPAAHCLTVNRDGIRKFRYWDIEPKREIRLRDDAEYAARFLDLFREAVRCRLRSHQPVGADLSGGLDSSSIVCVARDLINNGRVSVPGLKTFSWVFPGMECDESAYIRDAVEMWKLDAQSCFPKIGGPGEVDGVDVFYDQVRRQRDFPGYPNGGVINPLRRMAARSGCRALLTGAGGDEWFTGITDRAAELFSRFQIAAALSEAYGEAKWRGVADLARLMLNLHLRPLLPLSLVEAVSSGRRSRGYPEWIAADFARRVQLRDRLRSRIEFPRFTDFARRRLYGRLAKPWNAHTFETEEAAYAEAGIELRHPFEDRRVVEFGIGLPESQRQRDGMTKFVLRQAMIGLLPESIRQRRDKADFSHFFSAAFQIMRGMGPWESWQVVKQGWIVADKARSLRQAVERHFSEADNSPESRDDDGARIWELWMIVGIELWWREVFAASQA